MRKDLNKQLCERERVGSSLKYRTVRRNKKFNKNFDPDNMLQREGMRLRYKVTGDWKTLNENLNPLLGIIRKSVGKRWDDVYSEFCTVFNMNSVINNHILEHLFQFVETKLIMHNGVPMYRDFLGRPTPIDEWNGPLYYVHPESGILMQNHATRGYKVLQRQRRAKKAEEDAKVRRVISKDLELRLRDGTWFICELKDIPERMVHQYFDAYHKEPIRYEIAGRAFDLWEKATIHYGHEEAVRRRFGGRRVGKAKRYVCKVQTASRKLLKEHGITNQGPKGPFLLR